VDGIDQAGDVAPSSLFQRAGGEPFFAELTRTFYAGVAEDPLLRPLYPQGPDRMERARHHLELFLIQHFGGPFVYRAERGEGRLGQRHRHLAIGPAERDAWLRHMGDAVRSAGLTSLDQAQMLSFFAATADHLVNQRDQP
jgi:hemoglobin